MNALRVAALIVAPLFVTGCYSKLFEKTEYEKKIEAMPMPATEAERVEQCREFQSLASEAFVRDALQFSPRAYSGLWVYDSSESPALRRRLKAMNCPYRGWQDR